MGFLDFFKDKKVEVKDSEVEVIQIQDSIPVSSNSNVIRRRYDDTSYRRVIRDPNTLYTENDLAYKIVELPLQDLMQTGRSVFIKNKQGDLIEDEELIKNIYKIIERFDTENEKTLREAMIYGSALQYIALGHGEKDRSKPIELKKLNEYSLLNIVTFAHRDYTYNTYESNIENINYGKPDTYRATSIIGGSHTFHHSRCVEVFGKQPRTDYLYTTNSRYSVLYNLSTIITNLVELTADIKGMTNKANIDIIKIHDMYQSVCDMARGASAVDYNLEAYASEIKENVNNFNIMFMDDQNSFERHAYNFGGLTDILHSFERLVSAYSDIPHSRLFSQRESSLSGNDGNDMENYSRNIKNLQKHKLKKLYDVQDRIIEAMFDVVIEYNFNDYLQHGDTEKRANELTSVQTLTTLNSAFDVNIDSANKFLSERNVDLGLESLDLELETTEEEAEENENQAEIEEQKNTS